VKKDNNMCQTCFALNRVLPCLKIICGLELKICRVGHFRGIRGVCVVTIKAEPDWTDENVLKFHRFLGYLTFVTQDERRRMLTPSLLEILVALDVSLGCGGHIKK
jgi:hypothetical protein